MRAAAAGNFRRIQARRAARPSDPCAVLLGAKEARDRVREALGGRAAGEPEVEDDEEGCLRAEVLEGMVLVEPPEVLSDSAEVTELATFLKGLQYVHGLLLALGADGSCGGSSDADGKTSADSLPLLLDFFESTGGQDFVAVALVGVPSVDVEAAEALALEGLRRRGISPGGEWPAIFCLENVSHARQLVEMLRAREPVFCEPLRSQSPMLDPYRAIRAQLELQRPLAPAPARKPDGAPAAPVSPQGSDFPVITGAAAPGGRSTDSRRFTVMVFGRTGSGKSHLGNLLVGFPAFASGDSLASVTNQQSVRRATSPDGSITVLDTIGFGDTRLPPEVVMHSLRDTALEAPDGIDALFFVLKKERVTDTERETLEYVTHELFGRECLPNLYLVVTHAGRLAKEVELRYPWLREQAEASPQFSSMLHILGSADVDVMRRVAFVENPDPSQVEDDQDRALTERRRQRARDDIAALLERHKVPPYRHSMMVRAGELQQGHLEELRRELRAKVEEEVRQELDKDRSQLESDREMLRAEVEAQRSVLQSQEQEMRRRFEEEWQRMRAEFEQRARDAAREDLEPLAKEVVDSTESNAKAKGRWCSVM